MLADRRVRWAGAIGLVEWITVAGLFLIFGSDGWLLIGAVLVVTTWAQMATLFYFRKPQGALAEAQALFTAGQHQAAAEKLELWIAEGHTEDVEVQTLLGNAYRQIGKLEDSQRVLEWAITLKENDPFPLYGLGRTLLARGDFDGAVHYIQKALDNGGRKVIRVELALAHYLNGNSETAADEAKRAARSLPLEPQRILMANYLLHKLMNDPQATDLIERTGKSLAYWEEEAKRFSDTPYGMRLQAEITDLQRMLTKDITYA